MSVVLLYKLASSLVGALSYVTILFFGVADCAIVRLFHQTKLADGRLNGDSRQAFLRDLQFLNSFSTN